MVHLHATTARVVERQYTDNLEHRFIQKTVSPQKRSQQVDSQAVVGSGGRPLARGDVVAKNTSGRMEQLDLDSTSNLPNTPPPQFARFTVNAKAAPGRRCSSRHSLTLEELSLRGRIVFCVESCTRHCLSRAPPPQQWQEAFLEELGRS